jgi:uncharacterized protein with NAD-binding domain and iron-sulfur cluster
MKAIIMGGGMGGLATAINLLDLGVDVSLVEADEMFGGRASSWLDEDGDMIDNALHVFFPYYVNLLEFFRKLGIYENIAWKKTEFYYALPGGKHAVLRFKALPAPFHAVFAFANMLKDYRDLTSEGHPRRLPARRGAFHEQAAGGRARQDKHGDLGLPLGVA